MATFTQTCNNNTVGMSSSYAYYGLDLTDAQFYSQTVSSVKFYLTADSSTTATVTCYIVNPDGTTSQLGSSHTGTIGTSETEISFTAGEGEGVLGSSGGYLMLGYSSSILRIVVGDSTIITPCSPSSTTCLTARMTSGLAISTLSNNYTKIEFEYTGSSPGGSGARLPPPPIVLGGY